MRLKFLCVVAHPHDFTHCAGTMGIHHANGDECVVSSSSPSCPLSLSAVVCHQPRPGALKAHCAGRWSR